LQQVGTGPDFRRRASQSPALHPVLETDLPRLAASKFAVSACPGAGAWAQTKRITRICGKLASAQTAQVEDLHSKIVAPHKAGPLSTACWPPSGQIGGSAGAVEGRDMVAHAAEMEALEGPLRQRGSAAGLRTHPKRGGLRA